MSKLTIIGSEIKKTKSLLIAVLLIVTAFIAGCASEEEVFNETTVTIDNKGRIKHTIVESFDKTYYDENELRDLIDKELKLYCQNKDEEDAAVLKSLTIREEVATALIELKSYEDYAAFNEVDFFYGTVEEAMEHEYTTDVTLKSAEDDTTINGYEFESLSDSKMVVVSEPVEVILPGKIAYTTANIEVLDRDRARMASDTVGVGYILLK